jgi:carbon-monoxide dehydrogenase large subunit
VSRVEDAALVSGSARFVDDFEPDGTAHVAIVRSPVASADIAGIDVSGAVTTARVLRVITHADVTDLRWDQLLPGPPQRSALAIDQVRYHGDPVAAVVADDRHAAFDGRDAVRVDYDLRPAVMTIEAATAPGAPAVYDEVADNIGYREAGDPTPGLFDDADIVIETTLRNHRIAPGMLEGRAILAIPAGETVTVYCSHQMPHALRDRLAATLGLEPSAIRVVAPEVGGGFGAKTTFYQEYPLVVRLALEMQRPVKYVETRTENLLVTSHGRAQTGTIALGARSNGRITGMRVRTAGDLGAAIESQRWCLHLGGLMLAGCYTVPAIDYEILGVFTNTSPVGAFRGAGRPEAAYAIERSIDRLGRELGIDPVEMRRRNFVPTDAFPHETGLGSTYDSGAYEAALDLALARLDYAGLRTEQAARRAHGAAPLLGIGIASYVELSGGGQEYGDVTIHDTGEVVVRTGTSPHGQGHRTTWAQIVSEKLGVPFGAVRVLHGDTGVIPRGGGTAGSRSAPLGGAAVGLAADRAAARLRDLAAEHLEAAPEDIRLADGRAHVAGTSIGVAIKDLVGRLGVPVREEALFVAEGLTYPFGTHACAVEIDPDTGEVHVLEYVAVDDCGTVINPIITEGQVHGGVLQGVSHALREEVVYDDGGSLATGNWATYQIPSFGQRVEVDAVRTETPSPNNLLGVKGIGEAGATGSTPAIANAVADALAPLGVEESDLPMPYTPSKVWTAVQRARETA